MESQSKRIRSTPIKDINTRCRKCVFWSCLRCFQRICAQFQLFIFRYTSKFIAISEQKSSNIFVFSKQKHDHKNYNNRWDNNNNRGDYNNWRFNFTRFHYRGRSVKNHYHYLQKTKNGRFTEYGPLRSDSKHIRVILTLH